MGLLSSIGSYMLGGSSGFFILFVVPIVLLVGILWVCKMYNFSLMPDGLQGKKPQPFKFPKLSREKQGRMYKWNVDDSEMWDDSDDEDDEYDEDEDITSASHRASAVGPRNLYD